MFGNFQKYNIKPNNENKIQSASSIFDTTKFLAGIDASYRKFLSEMINTQCFTTFIEKCYKAKEEKDDLQWFIEASKCYSEKEFNEQLKKICEKALTKHKNVNKNYFYLVFSLLHTH